MGGVFGGLIVLLLLVAPAMAVSAATSGSPQSYNDDSSVTFVLDYTEQLQFVNVLFEASSSSSVTTGEGTTIRSHWEGNFDSSRHSQLIRACRSVNWTALRSRYFQAENPTIIADVAVFSIHATVAGRQFFCSGDAVTAPQELQQFLSTVRGTVRELAKSAISSNAALKAVPMIDYLQIAREDTTKEQKVSERLERFRKGGMPIHEFGSQDLRRMPSLARGLRLPFVIVAGEDVAQVQTRVKGDLNPFIKSPEGVYAIQFYSVDTQEAMDAATKAPEAR